MGMDEEDVLDKRLNLPHKHPPFLKRAVQNQTILEFLRYSKLVGIRLKIMRKKKYVLNWLSPRAIIPIRPHISEEILLDLM